MPMTEEYKDILKKHYNMLKDQIKKLNMSKNLKKSGVNIKDWKKSIKEKNQLELKKLMDNLIASSAIFTSTIQVNILAFLPHVKNIQLLIEKAKKHGAYNLLSGERDLIMIAGEYKNKITRHTTFLIKYHKKISKGLNDQLDKVEDAEILKEVKKYLNFCYTLECIDGFPNPDLVGEALEILLPEKKEKS